MEGKLCLQATIPPKPTQSNQKVSKRLQVRNYLELKADLLGENPLKIPLEPSVSGHDKFQLILKLRKCNQSRLDSQKSFNLASFSSCLASLIPHFIANFFTAARSCGNQ
jgi:hypothetical protein